MVCNAQNIADASNVANMLVIVEFSHAKVNRCKVDLADAKLKLLIH